MQKEVCCAFNMGSSSALIMTVSGKEGGEKKTMISGVAEEKPNYKKTAGKLLTACRDFFKNPENEEAFETWTKTGRQSYSPMC